MTPLINFAEPANVLIATVLFILVIVLAKETKKSWIPAALLGVFLIIIAGHSIELATTNAALTELKSSIARCITYDFIFIFLSFFTYLWIDDIEAKENKKKSLDDSLSWFWTKV